MIAEKYQHLVHPIMSEEQHEAVLDAIEELWNVKSGTPEEAALDILVLLSNEYEDRMWPIDPPTPLEAIRFRMEQRNYGQSDLARLLNSRPKASEILHGKRGLSIADVRKLHREWAIPAESLIAE